MTRIRKQFGRPSRPDSAQGQDPPAAAQNITQPATPGQVVGPIAQPPTWGTAAGGTWGYAPVMTAGMTFGEYGQTGLRQFSGWVRDEFLPQLVGRQGARTYREMRDNSPIIAGVLHAIRSTMRKVEWRVIPPSDSPEAKQYAEFVEGLMDDMTHSWEEHVDESLTMLEFGYSVHEIVYKRRLGRDPGPDPDRPGHDLPKSQFDDGLIGWRRLPTRAQETILKWFFDEHGQIKGVTQLPWTGPILDLPIEKIMIFRPNSWKGNPEGRSVLRSCFRPYHLIKRIEEQEAILFERLNGVPVVRVPDALIEQAAAGNSQAVAQLNAYKMIATNLRVNEQMGVVLSSGTYEGAQGQPSSVYKFDIKLVSPEGRRTAVQSNDILERYNVQMMTSLMSDFLHLGHSARGTQGLAETKVDMFYQAIEGYLNSNAGVYNRHGLPRVWKLNGIAADLMPDIQPDMAQRVDLDVLSNFVLRLAQAGMPLFPNEELQSYLLDAGGLPDIVDPLAMEAAGLTDELIGADTARAMATVPDPQADTDIKGSAVPGAGQQKPGGYDGGNLQKIIKASLARRLMRYSGPRFGIRTHRAKRASGRPSGNGRLYGEEFYRRLVDDGAFYEMRKAAEIIPIYLIRHGSTALNRGDPEGGTDGVAERIRGWKDVPLTAKGREEARRLAAQLADSGLEVIVYSTLTRARDTAAAVADATGASLVASDDLKPWNLGRFTGESSETVAPQLEHYVEHPNETVPGGETFNAFRDRVFEGLREAIDLAAGQNLGIVTHHRVERLFNAWIAAGEKPDFSIDPKVMLDFGENPGGAEIININATALRRGLAGKPDTFSSSHPTVPPAPQPKPQRRKLNGGLVGA